jgi:hypothetical protein
MLFSDKREQHFYQRLGFENFAANGRWLAIDEVSSHSIIEKSIGDILMMRTETPEIFRDQTIDLLGEMF